MRRADGLWDLDKKDGAGPGAGSVVHEEGVGSSIPMEALDSTGPGPGSKVSGLYCVTPPGRASPQSIRCDGGFLPNLLFAARNKPSGPASLSGRAI